MWNRLALLATLAACGNRSKLDGRADTDALWALAPDHTDLAIVMSARGVGLVERAAAAVAELAKQPDFAPVRDTVESIIGDLFGSSPAEAGLASDRGFALFVTGAGQLAVMPIADRDKFVAARHGKRGKVDTVGGSTCQPVRDLYACATSDALFARLGTGDLRGKIAAAGGRGDLEIIAPKLALLGASGDLAIAATLAPGELSLRGRWTGAAPVTAPAPALDPSRASGFAIANLAPLVTEAPPLAIAPDVTLADFAHSLAGPVTIVIPSGSVDLEVHVPLVDPAPAQAMIEHCATLPLIDATPGGPPGECRFHLRDASRLSLTAWVEGKELRLAEDRRKPAPGAAGALTAIGKELAAGTWTAALWGRGSMLDLGGGNPTSAQLPPEAALAIHAIALVDELGAAIRLEPGGVTFRVYLRTAWTNPPDVAAQLVAVSGDDIASGRATERGKAIAAGAPDSPFAADFAAGQGGLIVPAAVLGVAASFVLQMLRAQPAAAEPIHSVDKAQLAQLLVRAYVVEAYPEWQKANPGKACPASLAELAGFLGAPPDVPTMVDPWDRPLVMLCGNDLPAGAHGVAILSLGADGQLGTADDIKSW